MTALRRLAKATKPVDYLRVRYPVVVRKHRIIEARQMDTGARYLESNRYDDKVMID